MSSRLSGLVCSDFIGFRVLLLFEACVIGEQEEGRGRFRQAVNDDVGALRSSSVLIKRQKCSACQTSRVKGRFSTFY